MKTGGDFRKLSRVFALVILIFSIPLVTICLHVAELWQVRHEWPSTIGTVSRVSQKGWWDDGEKRYCFLEYQYNAGGKERVSRRIHPRDKSITPYFYMLRGVKKGDPIKVWYQNDDPGQPVVNAEYMRDRFAMLMAFSGFIVMLATMIVKEKQWQKYLNSFSTLMALNYSGSQPLPSSDIITDRGDYIKLDTGMSVFWNTGIPYCFASFAAMFGMISFLPAINSDWTLLHYLYYMGANWFVALLFCFIFRKGFDHSLVLDDRGKIIREMRTLFFKSTEVSYKYSDILGIETYRGKWSADNSLPNPVLFLRTKLNRSLFISCRNRDIQPAIEGYLQIVKQRLEYFLSR